MALCSQAFNTATKRSCNFNSNYNTPRTKKLCLNYPIERKKSVCIYSSSDDNESDDEQSCYKANQIKAKRRASTRVSFSLNPKLSKAISQYSDDDDEEEENFSRRNSIAAAAINNNSDDTCIENLDCKLSSSPRGSFFQISDAKSSPGCIKNSVPDKSARARCFDYLVGAIDEAWARYCDATTNVEDEVYGYNTPASVATDEEDCFGNTTDITDYETDFEESHHKPQHQPQQFRPRLASSASISSLCSEDPSSCQLQELKDRLTKAKYYLQDLVDSDDYNDVCSFWKRWDMIKYATIELVEDDDDDEIVESTIEELESGRLFVQ